MLERAKGWVSGLRGVEIYPRIPLEAEIERQVGRYLALGFPRDPAIAMSKGKFKDQMMGLVVSQPKSFEGRLDTPLLAEGRISVKRQCEMAGIDYYLQGLNKGDWADDPMGYRTPKTPYLAWTDEGTRFMNREVQDVRTELLPDERGGTELDAIDLHIVKPQVLQRRSLDLPGTFVESDSAACLGLWGGRPRLGYGFVGSADPDFDSLVCGR